MKIFDNKEQLADAIASMVENNLPNGIRMSETSQTGKLAKQVFTIAIENKEGRGFNLCIGDTSRLYEPYDPEFDFFVGLDTIRRDDADWHLAVSRVEKTFRIPEDNLKGLMDKIQTQITERCI